MLHLLLNISVTMIGVNWYDISTIVFTVYSLAQATAHNLNLEHEQCLQCTCMLAVSKFLYNQCF